MNQEINKKEIQERINLLRQKLNNPKKKNDRYLEQIDQTTHQKNEIALEERNFFYILETKTLLISFLVCAAIIVAAYILSIKTNYLSDLASLVFRLFS